VLLEKLHDQRCDSWWIKMAVLMDERRQRRAFGRATNCTILSGRLAPVRAIVELANPIDRRLLLFKTRQPIAFDEP
jgi:hypothetical protein